MHAEVGHCDVAARRGDELVLIEMKRGITVDLLVQVVRRQRARAGVYAAVPAPKRRDRRWRERERLLRRLEAGLLLVTLPPGIPRVEVVFHPMPAERRSTAAATRAILKEMAGRSASLNQAGVSRRKLVTAYREQALGLAVALAALGPSAPAELRRRGCTPRATAILYANVYGWFEHLGPALYGVTVKGREAIAEYAELAAALRDTLRLQ